VQSPWYDVFISHSHGDDRPARVLAENLRALGARVFLDVDSLTIGGRWRDATQNALSKSRAVAVLASSRRAQQGGASEELRMAIDSARTGEQLLVPIFLDEPASALFPELDRFHGLQAEDDDGLRDAAEQIAESLGIEAVPSSFPVVSPLLQNTSSRYIDTGLTELLMSAVRSSWEQPSGPLYVIGIGGVGKTTLVAEVCRQLLPESQIVWWVSATSLSATVADLAALGASLKIAVEDGLEEQARAAVLYLEHVEDKKWTLVFDDVWSLAEVDRWIPVSPATGATIVVSRNRPNRRFDRVFALDPLDESESLRFLRRLLDQSRYRVEPGSEGALLDLVRMAGGSPLALSLVAGLIQESPETLRPDSLSRFEAGAGPHDWSLQSLIGSSLRRASQSSQEAAILLSAIAWTADPGLPEHLLLRGAQDALGSEVSFDALQAALRDLGASGLIEVSATTVTADPLVKAAAQRNVDPRGVDALLGALAIGLNQSSGEQAMASATALYPHFVRAVGLLERLDSPQQAATAVALLVREAWSLQRTGRYSEAVELLQRTLFNSERVLGPDHPSTLTVRTSLASVYRGLGRYSEAVELLQRTLLDSERVLGEDHPSTLSVRANLASAYQDLGRYSEAVQLLQRTLLDSERVLGGDHPSTLSVRANLASAYQDMGRRSEAVDLLQRTLLDSERVLGGDHPSTLTVRANLASAYQDMGRHEEALALLQRTLLDSERVLGADHPSTLTVRANLAYLSDHPAGHRRGV